MAQLNHEPSMEDILASIKRIIAEDSEAAAPRAARQIRREMASIQSPVGHAPVVTEAEFEPAPSEISPAVEPVAEVAPIPEPARAAAVPEEATASPVEATVEPDAADVLELTSPLAEDVPESPPAPPEPAPVQAAQPKPIRPKVVQSKPTPPEPAQPIQPQREPVSTMDRLMSDNAATASRSAFAALTQLQVRAEAGQENTLEGLVSDLLRPMLREWLDRELPAMVERMVAAEIGRVSGRA